jgi:hypothetical protein
MAAEEITMSLSKFDVDLDALDALSQEALSMPQLPVVGVQCAHLAQLVAIAREFDAAVAERTRMSMLLGLERTKRVKAEAKLESFKRMYDAEIALKANGS